ncbi:MAG: MFS transporter [Dehalococcoidia bacterium]
MPGGRPRRRYYGWVMVAVGALINGVGSINGAMSSVFFLPLTTHLGVGHGALAFALSLARLEAGMVGPAAGWLLDRKGPRVTITLGCLMGGIGLLLLPFVNSFLMFLLLYMGAISIGFNMGFALSMHQVANIWFVRHRTKVLGIFSFSIRLGRALFIPLLAFVTVRYGWQSAAWGAGVFVLVVVLPLTVLVRRSPEELGQRPDGEAPVEETPASGLPRPSRAMGPEFTFAQGLRTRAYWIIVLSTLTRTSLGGAVQGQLIPIAVSKGMSQAAGAGFLSAWALLASVTLLLVGYAADRHSKRVLMGIGHAATLVGMLALLTAGPDDWPLMVLFVVCLSFAEGMAPANLSIIGDLFGRSAFGRLNGMLTTFTTVGILAPPFLGYSYDRYGDYTLPLATFATIAAVAMVVVLLLLRPPAPPPARADAAEAPAAVER